MVGQQNQNDSQSTSSGVDIENTLIEVQLVDDKSFSRICEVLKRIGIPNFSSHTIYQSGHILHKKHRYYIVHFKQMLMLDGRQVNFDDNDIARIRAIAALLEQWNLVKIIHDPYPGQVDIAAARLFVINRRQIDKWTLVTKYLFGRSKIGKRNRDSSVNTKKH